MRAEGFVFPTRPQVRVRMGHPVVCGPNPTFQKREVGHPTLGAVPGTWGGEGGLLAAEDFYGGSSEEEAGDVRYVGDSSVLNVGDGAYVD